MADAASVALLDSGGPAFGLTNGNADDVDVALISGGDRAGEVGVVDHPQVGRPDRAVRVGDSESDLPYHLIAADRAGIGAGRAQPLVTASSSFHPDISVVVCGATFVGRGVRRPSGVARSNAGTPHAPVVPPGVMPVAESL